MHACAAISGLRLALGRTGGVASLQVRPDGARAIGSCVGVGKAMRGKARVSVGGGERSLFCFLYAFLRMYRFFLVKSFL